MFMQAIFVFPFKAPFPYVRIRHPASGMRIRHADPASGYSVSICTDITDIYRCNIVGRLACSAERGETSYLFYILMTFVIFPNY